MPLSDGRILSHEKGAGNNPDPSDLTVDSLATTIPGDIDACFLNHRNHLLTKNGRSVCSRLRGQSSTALGQRQACTWNNALFEAAHWIGGSRRSRLR